MTTLALQKCHENRLIMVLKAIGLDEKCIPVLLELNHDKTECSPRMIEINLTHYEKVLDKIFDTLAETIRPEYEIFKDDFWLRTQIEQFALYAQLDYQLKQQQ